MWILCDPLCSAQLCQLQVLNLCSMTHVEPLGGGALAVACTLVPETILLEPNLIVFSSLHAILAHTCPYCVMDPCMAPFLLQT